MYIDFNISYIRYIKINIHGKYTNPNFYISDYAYKSPNFGIWLKAPKSIPFLLGFLWKNACNFFLKKKLK